VQSSRPEEFSHLEMVAQLLHMVLKLEP